MGCGQSKQLDVQQDTSRIEEVSLPHQSNIRGVQVFPTIAVCSATTPLQTWYRVFSSAEYILCALFEAHASPEAAAFSHTQCHEVFEKAMKEAHGNVADALQRTFVALDKRFLNSHEPTMVRAAACATGIVAHLDLGSLELHVATLGKGTAIVSQAQGSFENSTALPKVLPGTPARPVHQSPSSRRLPLPAPDTPTASSQLEPPSPGAASTPGSTRAGPTARLDWPSNAVGLGFAKEKRFADWLRKHLASSPARAQADRLRASMAHRAGAACVVERYSLSKGDEHVVLASQGLVAEVDPREAAVLGHHFSADKMTELREVLRVAGLMPALGTPAAAPARQDVSSSRPAPTGPAKPSKRAQDAATATSTTLPNMASLLVNRAVVKSLDRHNAGCMLGSELTRKQLLGSVPLAQQPTLSPKPGASSAAAPGQQHQLTRRQVHGDMCAVVLSLAWPQSSTSKPAVGAAIAAAGQRSRARAKYHWHLLRQYVKFYKAWRHSLRSRWWSLAKELLASTKEQARASEIRAWRRNNVVVQVSRTGQVTRRSPGKTDSPSNSAPLISKRTSGGGTAPAPAATPPRGAAYNVASHPLTGITPSPMASHTSSPPSQQTPGAGKRLSYGLEISPLPAQPEDTMAGMDSASSASKAAQRRATTGSKASPPSPGATSERRATAPDQMPGRASAASKLPAISPSKFAFPGALAAKPSAIPATPATPTRAGLRTPGGSPAKAGSSQGSRIPRPVAASPVSAKYSLRRKAPAAGQQGPGGDADVDGSSERLVL